MQPPYTTGVHAAPPPPPSWSHTKQSGAEGFPHTHITVEREKTQGMRLLSIAYLFKEARITLFLGQRRLKLFISCSTRVLNQRWGQCFLIACTSKLCVNLVC